MRKLIGLLGIAGTIGLLTSAQAQAPASSAFDGTYRAVSGTNVNATYTDRNGRMGTCPARKPGPLHIVNGEARYTTATGYKLRGTVSPQGDLALGLVAPGNAGNAGAQPVNLKMSGQIDGSGTVRVRQTGASCSYDFVWQKAAK
ncbi:MAG TPA: hypothetical protein VGR45_13895 [Stellaceae bacterium]|nr:hypothetical protein [Stellaceae bacterium]